LPVKRRPQARVCRQKPFKINEKSRLITRNKRFKKPFFGRPKAWKKPFLTAFLSNFDVFCHFSQKYRTQPRFGHFLTRLCRFFIKTRLLLLQSLIFPYFMMIFVVFS
jgi:hypothetical protein